MRLPDPRCDGRTGAEAAAEAFAARVAVRQPWGVRPGRHPQLTRRAGWRRWRGWDGSGRRGAGCGGRSAGPCSCSSSPFGALRS